MCIRDRVGCWSSSLPALPAESDMTDNLSLFRQALAGCHTDPIDRADLLASLGGFPATPDLLDCLSDLVRQADGLSAVEVRGLAAAVRELARREPDADRLLHL